jgi:hypothetical protein
MIIWPLRFARWLFITTGAMTFAVGSLAAFVVMLRQYDPDPAAVNALIQVQAGERAIAPAWLSYSGDAGFLLAVVQATVLMAALMVSCLRDDWPRRLALLLLLGWSTLVSAGVWHLVQQEPMMTMAPAAILSLMSMATLMRTIRRWPHQPTREERRVMRQAKRDAKQALRRARAQHRREQYAKRQEALHRRACARAAARKDRALRRAARCGCCRPRTPDAAPDFATSESVAA